MAKAQIAAVEDMDDGIESIVEFSEDIANAEAPEPLPEREYPAQISKATKEISAAKGTLYAKVFFRINEEDYPADYDVNNAPGGKEVMHIIGLEDNAQSRHRVRKFCEAIGAPMSRRINVAEWVGLDAKITIKHDTYEGVVREKVQKVDVS
jgi:hypothetical protein